MFYNYVLSILLKHTFIIKDKIIQNKKKIIIQKNCLKLYQTGNKIN